MVRNKAPSKSLFILLLFFLFFFILQDSFPLSLATKAENVAKPVFRAKFTATSYSAAQQSEFDRLLAEGKKLFLEEMDNERALAKFKEAEAVAQTREQTAEIYFYYTLIYYATSRDRGNADFEAAATADPANALYLYHSALTMYDQYGAEAAADALQRAIQAERRQPVANWGQAMERIQGQGQLWLEKARRDAGRAR